MQHFTAPFKINQLDSSIFLTWFPIPFRFCAPLWALALELALNCNTWNIRKTIIVSTTVATFLAFMTKIPSNAKGEPAVNTYAAYPMKSWWFVLIYDSSMSMRRVTCSLARTSPFLVWVWTTLSTSSRNRGYFAIWRGTHLNQCLRVGVWGCGEEFNNVESRQSRSNVSSNIDSSSNQPYLICAFSDDTSNFIHH
jgi:hypothetical protein